MGADVHVTWCEVKESCVRVMYMLAAACLHFIF